MPRYLARRQELTGIGSWSIAVTASELWNPIYIQLEPASHNLSRLLFSTWCALKPGKPCWPTNATRSNLFGEILRFALVGSQLPSLTFRSVSAANQNTLAMISGAFALNVAPKAQTPHESPCGNVRAKSLRCHHVCPWQLLVFKDQQGSSICQPTPRHLLSAW